MRRTALLAVLAVALAAAPRPAPAQDATVVYLVRHGETAPDGTRNPPLSEEGRDRARALARALADAGVTHLHSTELARTQQTGAPIAGATGLEIASYDPRDLEGFAARLRATPGRHLVLGHSNTTPALVAALGGDPGAPIAEDEHDRLYVVVLGANGPATVLLRYGAPSGG